MKRRIRNDDRAVAAVVGAIIVLGIVVSMLVTVRVSFVPVWTAQAEAKQASNLEQELGDIAFALNRHLSDNTPYVFASTISMAPQQTPGFFNVQSLGERVHFQPDLARATVSSTRLVIVENNGTDTSLADNQWRDLSGSEEVLAVGQAVSLRLRLETFSSAQDGSQVVVSLTDKDAAFAGSLTFRVQATASSLLARYDIRNAANEVISSFARTYDLSATFVPFVQDLLDSETAFDQVVAAAAKPMKVRLTETATTGVDYSISFWELANDGRRYLTATGGDSRTPYTQSMHGGRLTFETRNNNFPDQTYVLEHGAMILSQVDGTIFKLEPSFSVFRVGSTTVLQWNAPSMRGTAADYTGDLLVTALTELEDRQAFSARAPRLTFNLDTQFPTVWANHFRNALEDAGLTDSGAQPQFSLSTTTASVTLNVFGLTSDPGSTELDLGYRFVQANVKLRLEV